MSNYSVAEASQATDYMAEYPDFGQMLSYTSACDAEQVALTLRRMPPGTGGRGSYGHWHGSQEEIYLVISGPLTFKVDDDVFEAADGTAVRVAPQGVRSVHNDGSEEAVLVICSVIGPDDGGGKVEDFWPEKADQPA